MKKDSSGASIVSLRFDFYRDGLALSLMINLALAVLSICLGILVWNLAHRQPQTKYFSVDTRGVIVPLIPMNEPHMTDSAILELSAKVVAQSYTFDADNYRDAIMGVQQYYTSEGFEGFTKSMQAQIAYVKDNILIASAVPTGTPVLIKSGLINTGAGGDVVAWKIRVPVLVTYRSKGDSSTVRRVVTLVIVNRPTYETPYGVGVSSFQAQDQN